MQICVGGRLIRPQIVHGGMFSDGSRGFGGSSRTGDFGAGFGTAAVRSSPDPSTALKRYLQSRQKRSPHWGTSRRFVERQRGQRFSRGMNGIITEFRAAHHRHANGHAMRGAWSYPKFAKRSGSCGTFRLRANNEATTRKCLTTEPSEYETNRVLDRLAGLAALTGNALLVEVVPTDRAIFRC